MKVEKEYKISVQRQQLCLVAGEDEQSLTQPRVRAGDMLHLVTPPSAIDFSQLGMNNYCSLQFCIDTFIQSSLLSFNPITENHLKLLLVGLLVTFCHMFIDTKV